MCRHLSGDLSLRLPHFLEWAASYIQTDLLPGRPDDALSFIADRFELDLRRNVLHAFRPMDAHGNPIAGAELEPEERIAWADRMQPVVDVLLRLA